MADRHEIRKAHEIVDKIYPPHEREAVRKLLPPRPEVTFGETIQALKGLASGDDIHLWAIIRQLERFEKSHPRIIRAKEELDSSPDGTIVARDGSWGVWYKRDEFWHCRGDLESPASSSWLAGSDWRVLRWGLDGD